ncbi:hypothetical protein ABIF65_008252 [Bradyrhizobium japonicum]
MMMPAQAAIDGGSAGFSASRSLFHTNGKLIARRYSKFEPQSRGSFFYPSFRLVAATVRQLIGNIDGYVTRPALGREHDDANRTLVAP